VLRQEKEVRVKKIQEIFSKTNTIYLIDYSGMSVAELEELRGTLRDNEVKLLVVKNRLAKRALEDTTHTSLSEHFQGMTAIAYSERDATEPARVINKFIKKKEKPTFKNGLFEGNIFTRERMEQIATLPDQDHLRSMLLNLFQSTQSRFIGLLSTVQTNLLCILKQRASQ